MICSTGSGHWYHFIWFHEKKNLNTEKKFNAEILVLYFNITTDIEWALKYRETYSYGSMMRDISSNFFSQFFVNINIGIGGYFEIRNIITGDKVTDLLIANFRLSWNCLGSDYNKGGHSFSGKIVVFY